VPTRRDILPEHLGSHLTATSMMEVEAPDRAIIRLTAQQNQNYSGVDRRGENVIDLTSPEQRQTRIDRFQTVVNRPCGGLSINRFKLVNRGEVTTPAILLPAAGKAGEPARFLYSAMDLPARMRWDDLWVPGHIPIAEEFWFIDIGAG
jgi:hypothetical protein